MASVARFSNSPILNLQSLSAENEFSFIPSSILNPPNHPFRKRYASQASQLSLSPGGSPSRKRSNLNQDMKYLVNLTKVWE